MKAILLNCSLKKSSDKSSTQALAELGFTVPGQAFTYFNNGAAMGDDYTDSGNKPAKDKARQNAEGAAHNIAAVARALQGRPIPPTS